jgi:hypothetical protein
LAGLTAGADKVNSAGIVRLSAPLALGDLMRRFGSVMSGPNWDQILFAVLARASASGVCWLRSKLFPRPQGATSGAHAVPINATGKQEAQSRLSRRFTTPVITTITATGVIIVTAGRVTVGECAAGDGWWWGGRWKEILQGLPKRWW